MAKRKKNKLNEVASTEQTKLFTNLLKIARQYIQGRSYAPVSLQVMMQRLGLPEQHTATFSCVIKALIKEGCIQLKHGIYHHAALSEKAVTGIISMHPRGFGFVKQDEPTDEGDIFIPKHLTMNAVDGDHVEVIVNADAPSDKGPEGKVIGILSRSRTHIAGIITQASEYGEILAYVPLLGTQQRIVVRPSEEFDLREGDRVVMKVLDWGSKESDTECVVSHYLGHISDPSCDIAAAIEEYEILCDFPKKVLDEAGSFGKLVTKSDMEGRQDLRHLECFTIDPTTAKDFDDALTVTKDDKGCYHLIVHIADVSHYVKEGSALDKEASRRCNSTYFPGTCIPMLPKDLSENLCSLKANVNRLAVSVAIDFDIDGNLQSYQIFRSVIRSSKRFTYNEAKEVLDGKKRSKHASTLKLMVELCKLLKKKRFERGSLEFALPDLVVKIDDQGVPTGTEYVSYDITHQMVEEFMLKANEIVAQHLDKQGKHLAYRVHEEPSLENMKDFALLANAFGFNLPETPSSQDLQQLFDEALETPYGQYLAVSYIRRMRQAMYSPENIGHYGLGLTHYCHFTSPIRRYVDLVVHRSIFHEGLEYKKLDQIAKESSEQERISAKAENHVLLLKKLRLLNQIHEKNPYKQYEAVITRVKNFGFSFEILDFLLEGFLHVSELDNDYFVFNDKQLQLCGRHTGTVYSSGERITVMLKEVDYILLESKWSLVRGEGKGKPLSERKRGSKRLKLRGRREKRPQEQEVFREHVPPALNPKKTKKAEKSPKSKKESIEGLAKAPSKGKLNQEAKKAPLGDKKKRKASEEIEKKAGTMPVKKKAKTEKSIENKAEKASERKTKVAKEKKAKKENKENAKGKLGAKKSSKGKAKAIKKVSPRAQSKSSSPANPKPGKINE